MTQLIGRQLGRYLVQEEIGRGGMARVYRALDTSLRRTVALKVLAPHLAQDPEFERRFEREAVTVANLRHPNIVTVYDVGESNGLRYIAMEYIRGRTLHAIIRERGALGLALAIGIVAPVAAALDHAHAQGAVHRDIKPHNILIDIEGRVLLADFGIAQAPEGSGERLTRTGMFMGTPEYISPEQASAQRVDGRSDLYSLAVATYEIITGMVPFSGATPQLIIAHVQTPPPPPSAVDPQQPRELDLVLARALAKRPEQRFGTGAAFIEALKIVARRNNQTPASQQQIADLVLPSAFSPPLARAALIDAVRTPPDDAQNDAPTPYAQSPRPATAPARSAAPTPNRSAAPAPVRSAVPPPPITSQPAQERPAIRWALVAPIGAGIVIVALLALLFGSGAFGTSGQTRPTQPQATVLPSVPPAPASTWTPVPSPTFTSTPLPTDTATPVPPTDTPVPPTDVPVFIPPPPTAEPPTAEPPTAEPPTAEPPTAEPPTVTATTAPASPTATTISGSPTATAETPSATVETISVTPETPTATPAPASVAPPSATPTAAPSATPTAAPTAAPSATPSATPTAAPSATPTAAP